MAACSENNMLYQPDLFVPNSAAFPYTNDTICISPENIEYTNMLNS